jgi:adenosylhomocysteine nucleosidase
LFDTVHVIFALVIGEYSSADGTVSEKTGIIGAMEEEVNSLKEALSDSKVTTIAGMEFCEGKLDGEEVVIVQCGIGKVNAGICANTLINNFGCTKVINTGVAGSLDNQIDIGDIVIIRAISDKADDSEEMNYELFKKDAAEHCASVVRYMITHE